MTKEEIIKNLKYTMKKHKNDNVSTFGTNISVMCKDILDYLEQEPRKGHWISHIEHCKQNNLLPSGLGSYFWCSECDCGIDSKNFSRVNYNYCPNCGAKMV